MCHFQSYFTVLLQKNLHNFVIFFVCFFDSIQLWSKISASVEFITIAQKRYTTFYMHETFVFRSLFLVNCTFFAVYKTCNIVFFVVFKVYYDFKLFLLPFVGSCAVFLSILECKPFVCISINLMDVNYNSFYSFTFLFVFPFYTSFLDHLSK